MKKSQQKKTELGLEKFSIARIDNLSKIKGGLENCEDPDNDSSIRTDNTQTQN